MNEQQFLRHSWSYEEDERLITLVAQLGEKRWQAISEILSKESTSRHINGKACRERYKNHLAPNVNKTPWTSDEAKILFDNYKQYGPKWSEISQHLQGRTDNSIKNYFYATLRRSLRRMLKALGRDKSSNYLGKVKPHVLTQLFDLFSNEMPSKQIKELALIVHDVVDTFADEKHNNLNQQQLKDYQTVLINLQNLNRNYIVEKEVNKAAQRVNEKALLIQRKSKVIYKIKKYIKETRINQNIISRIKKKQNVFFFEHQPLKSNDSILINIQMNIQMNIEIKNQLEKQAQMTERFSSAKITSSIIKPERIKLEPKHEVELCNQDENELKNLNLPLGSHLPPFVQVSKPEMQLPAYYQMLQKITSPPSFYQIQQGIYEQLQQNQSQSKSTPQVSYPNFNQMYNLEYNQLAINQSLKQYQNYMQDQIKVEHKEYDQENFQLFRASQSHSYNQNMFKNLYDNSISVSTLNDQMMNGSKLLSYDQFSRIQSEFLEQMQSQQKLQLMISNQINLHNIQSVDSNIGTAGTAGTGTDNINREFNYFSEYYSITNPNPNPLKSLQKMNSDFQDKL